MLKIATGGFKRIPEDWMSATKIRPIIFDDPAVVWLEFHGDKHGFKPDVSDYDFLDFIGEKGRLFEKKWIKELAPEAVRVCNEPYDVTSAEKVKETFDLMQKNIPVISQPALWWAPERIYGVPDFIAHISWIKERFSDLLEDSELKKVHYIVFDLKFTTKLETANKATDLKNYSAQVRIYSYILGHMQKLMPQKGYLITRDRIFDFLPIKIQSSLNESLDTDLSELRDQFLEIKINGEKYVPWVDEIVSSNIANQDERWKTSKDIIAREKIEGMDTGLLYQIGPNAKRELKELGFNSLKSMLDEKPENVPLERCKGLGPKKSKQIRAILEANRTGSPAVPTSLLVPPQKDFEYFVDLEYFTNVNVDFDKQWEMLKGCEMIFMVGLGWEDEGKWSFETFVASLESHEKEKAALESFIKYLSDKIGDDLINSDKTALYHWSSAEVWQTKHASDRHDFPATHPLRDLPWCDLQKTFLNAPIGIPGALDYGLKGIANALGKIDLSLDPKWPGDLDEGLKAMVMGWKAYRYENVFETSELITLTKYLEADCRALRSVLKWLRSNG